MAITAVSIEPRKIGAFTLGRAGYAFEHQRKRQCNGDISAEITVRHVTVNTDQAVSIITVGFSD